MKRISWMKAVTAALVMAVALTAQFAHAAADKSPLSWAPATAPVVIHLNGLESVRDHVVAFVKNAMPDRVDMIQKSSDDFFKNGFAGRKLAGLAKDGPIFVVFTEMPKAGQPQQHLAIIAAISSYADFRDNILSDKEKKDLKKGNGYESTTGDTGDIFFVDKKDYVVVTPTKEVAVAFTKSAPGLDGKLSKAQAAKLLSSDFGVYVNMEDVNKEYADQIKDAHKQAAEQLKKVADTVGQAQKASFEMMAKLIDPAFQAVEDCQSALVTLEIRPGGVAMHTESELRTGSKTADSLKGMKTSAFKDMAKLPAGDVFYTGMKVDPALLKLSGSMLTGLSADPDGKGAKAFTEAFEELTKAGPSESIGAVTYPIAGLQIGKYSDPEKAVEGLVKMLEAMGTEGGFQNVYLKEKPEIKAKAQKYKNIDFTSIHMVWDLEKSLAAAGGAQPLPEAAKKAMAEAMKKLMGESMNAWFGTDGKVEFNVMAKDWESAEKTLDQYFKGEGTVGEDKAFTAARKELPAEATVVILMDAMQYAGVMLDFIKPIIESSGAQVPITFPKAVKGKPGFVGMAVTVTPEHGAFDLVVTAESVNQIYKNYVTPLLPKGD